MIYFNSRIEKQPILFRYDLKCPKVHSNFIELDFLKAKLRKRVQNSQLTSKKIGSMNKQKSKIIDLRKTERYIG